MIIMFNLMKHFPRVTNLWEISQYFRHLIPSLSTAHVDDDVAVGVLGQGLRDHSLPTAKGSGDSSGPSLDTAVNQDNQTKTIVSTVLG